MLRFCWDAIHKILIRTSTLKDIILWWRFYTALQAYATVHLLQEAFPNHFSPCRLFLFWPWSTHHFSPWFCPLAKAVCFFSFPLVGLSSLQARVSPSPCSLHQHPQEALSMCSLSWLGGWGAEAQTSEWTACMLNPGLPLASRRTEWFCISCHSYSENCISTILMR